MLPVEIAPKVHWVGALDPQIRVFDIIMRADNGTSYNAYLVRGEDKTALIEAVKAPFTSELLSNLRTLIDPARLDYIVLNHTEPDHSGAVEALLCEAEQAQVVVSKSARQFVRNILNRQVDTLPVGDGDSLDLGGRQLGFISAPFLHWPDTMFTYLPRERLLFPCDFLGSHFCDDRLFDDRVADFSHAFKYYFDTIMRPFKQHALQAIAKIRPLEIAMIAPSHGPILRTDPWRYVDAYEKWSQSPPPAQAKRLLVFYVSAYGNTARMAGEVARGAEEAGASVAVLDIASADMAGVVDQVEGADGIVVGSPTIQGDAVKPVWDMLSSLTTIKVRGKLGAAFGSYGWSGEAVKLIEERLRGLRLRVPEEAVTATLVPSEEDLARCREFGARLASQLG